MEYLDIKNEQELNEWVKNFVEYVVADKQDQAQAMMDVISNEDRIEVYNKVRVVVKETHPDVELPDLTMVEEPTADEEKVKAEDSEVEISDEVAKSDNAEQSDETLQEG